MLHRSFTSTTLRAPSEEGGATPRDPALEAETIDQIKTRLIPVSLKHFKDDRGFGFLIDAQGNEYFAHVSALRVADMDGRLDRADGMIITDAGFGDNPELYCIPGPGARPGQRAAVVWIGTDISR